VYLKAILEATSSVPKQMSEIRNLLAYAPDVTQHLDAFTHAAMRGPGPVSPGERELLAAMTSKANHCLF
jgi:alkylhydroperoxidase family enzyme